MNFFIDAFLFSRFLIHNYFFSIRVRCRSLNLDVVFIERLVIVESLRIVPVVALIILVSQEWQGRILVVIKFD